MDNPNQVKMALCMRRSDLPQMYFGADVTNWQIVAIDNGNSFYSTGTQLVDRALCETDENLLQLLPYVVAYVPETDSVFMYSRGKGGAEARLHAKNSIGLGGHVESPSYAYHGHLLALLSSEARREVQEEIGIDCTDKHVGFQFLLNDPTNPVGRVHLGILCLMQFSADAQVLLEKDVIENGKFVPVKSLMQESEYDKLEPWSQMAMKALFSGEPVFSRWVDLAETTQQ